MRCLNCKKDFDQTPGKRRKLYCSGKCRTAYCRNKKPKIKSKRGPGRPKKVKVGPLDPSLLDAVIREIFTEKAQSEIVVGPMKEVLHEASKETAKLGIEAMIAAIKAEKLPPNRDTPLGRKSWAVDQKKRIQELENKLNNI